MPVPEGQIAQQAPAREFGSYLTLAVVLAGAPIILFYREPIIYAHLIAEDFAGEYATAVTFAGAGLLFLVDALRAPRRGRKAISLFLALVAVAIAGEEVSWGQRALHHLWGIDVPAAIRAANLQQELNIHNLEAVGLSKGFYRIGSYVLLGWLGLSVVLSAIRPEVAARLSAAGIPLVPFRLIPLCVLPPAFFLLRPVAKGDEIGELLVGVAALSFAVDRAWSWRWPARTWLPTRATAVVISLFAAGLLALGLATFSPLGHMAWRLQMLAARDYMRFGMYEQAEETFQYIYAHPAELLAQDTRLSHAELLAAAGQLAESRRMLALAVEELGRESAAADSDILRRTGELYRVLGEEASAEEALAAAMAADRRSLATVVDADERAQLLFSLARTLAARGLMAEAANAAATAHRTAAAAQTRYRIESWLPELDARASRLVSDAAPTDD